MSIDWQEVILDEQFNHIGSCLRKFWLFKALIILRIKFDLLNLSDGIKWHSNQRSAVGGNRFVSVFVDSDCVLSYHDKPW